MSIKNWEKELDKMFFIKMGKLKGFAKPIWDWEKPKLVNLINALLTQQRTEILEEINNLEYGGYIQVMASKKNWDERNGYDKAKEDITNLLNKKDE